ncbi:cytochrome B [Bradyrhizobium canariense]|uniref:Cytochrome B n=1 Tax=Bradyrhizobium canariense TaxID=255045 RepID=A0ABX3WZI0_9BRAD|nr:MULTISPECIES: cytochrome b/b6 domain-containing protein [Bradyrhizobium]OSJ17134.1 cytochrome B [Bradyrhizobium canariense]OSJ25069.1 cytochrome B [Bradyrhizobium canariense]WOH61672.1 cytochrome b/b6 domain-containing protein [Bradyrhizobium sp. BWC-3-1]
MTSREEHLLDDVARYDPITIWLHWITVAFVVILWVIGQTADWFPRPDRAAMWSVHIVVGAILLVVLPTRVVWRMQFGRTLPSVSGGVQHLTAKLTHGSLYLLLAMVLLLGTLDASYRGATLFGTWSVPQFGAHYPTTLRAIQGWHGIGANTTVVIAALHAAAALVHQYGFRDRLLSRMKP